MYDIKQEILTHLLNVSDTAQYAQYPQPEVLPLVTYKLISSIDNKTCKAFGYSTDIVQIDIWTHSVAEATDIAVDIDAELRPIGLSRTYYTELPEDSRIHVVLQYECLVREIY